MNWEKIRIFAGFSLLVAATICMLAVYIPYRVVVITAGNIMEWWYGEENNSREPIRYREEP